MIISRSLMNGIPTHLNAVPFGDVFEFEDYLYMKIDIKSSSGSIAILNLESGKVDTVSGALPVYRVTGKFLMTGYNQEEIY